MIRRLYHKMYTRQTIWSIKRVSSIKIDAKSCWPLNHKNDSKRHKNKVLMIDSKVNGFVVFYLIYSCQWLDHRCVFLFYLRFCCWSRSPCYHLYIIFTQFIIKLSICVIAVENNNRFSTKRCHFDIKTYKIKFSFNDYFQKIATNKTKNHRRELIWSICLFIVCLSVSFIQFNRMAILTRCKIARLFDINIKIKSDR